MAVAADMINTYPIQAIHAYILISFMKFSQDFRVPLVDGLHMGTLLIMSALQVLSRQSLPPGRPAGS
jgi:hypothetical protein